VFSMPEVLFIDPNPAPWRVCEVLRDAGFFPPHR
jgi:hypothetical protein